MRALALCSSCKRHVKISEARCPFCNAAVVLDRSQVAQSPRGRPGGRAALFLTGAVLAAPGCADEHDPDDGQDSVSVPVYGVAIDAGTGPRPDAGNTTRDAGLIAQPYGIAPPLDASIQTRDAGPSCPQVGNLPAPVYGIGIDVPPRDSCSDAGADAGKDAGADAGKDAGADAGKDAGKDAEIITVPPYGIAVPAYGIAIDRDR